MSNECKVVRILPEASTPLWIARHNTDQSEALGPVLLIQHLLDSGATGVPIAGANVLVHIVVGTEHHLSEQLGIVDSNASSI